MQLLLLSVLLLGLAVACAQPMRIKPEKPSEETPPDTPPEELPPEDPPGPLHIPLTITSDLLEAQKAAIIDALETWEEATHGQVSFGPMFAETTCGQNYAIHVVPRGECGMTCNDETTGEDKCWRGRADPQFTITVAIDDLDVLYYAVVHELGHALGLDHGVGFMSTGADWVRETFFTGEQFDIIARRNNLKRDEMPTDGARFDYISHRDRAMPFIVYE